MRKTDCFLLALFALSIRGVQGVMLIYVASLCSVLDNLVLIIGVFLLQYTSGGEVHVYS